MSEFNRGEVHKVEKRKYLDGYFHWAECKEGLADGYRRVEFPDKNTEIGQSK